MKIRTRITLQFAIIVSVFLIIFSLTIYSLLGNFRREEFKGRLRDKALNSVKLLSEVDEVSHEMLQILEKNAVNPLPKQKVFIYNIHKKLVYSSLPKTREIISEKVLSRIAEEREIYIQQEKEEMVGLLFKGRYDNYLVVASAQDIFGYSKLNYLQLILVIGVVVAMLLIWVVGLFFSRQTLQPIANMVNQIDTITANNLNLRVNEGNTKDEIAQLAIKFNKMLERLDSAFEVQRSFVSNASHELRTPLTAITGQIEVTLMNNKVNQEGREILNSLLTDIKQLNKLSNGLLELAQASLDITEIELVQIRIDELVGIARAELLKRNQNYSVILNFEGFPEENWLTIQGNEQLILSAIINVLDNACKYSPNHTAFLDVSFNETKVILSITDQGMGISGEDLEQLYIPFFRSRNAKNKSGHGIGLPLTKKIIELHKGEIRLSSEIGKGTKVELHLPHQ
jgi:signal transduction histidine kinase